jgi:hypothetical protein
MIEGSSDLSSLAALTGRQLKQSVKVFHNLKAMAMPLGTLF